MKVITIEGEKLVSGCAQCEKQEVIDEADRLGVKATHWCCLECKARVLATLFEN